MKGNRLVYNKNINDINEVIKTIESNRSKNNYSDKYIKFDVANGLSGLRELILNIKGERIGIELIGNIGITSHFGDLLRLSNIPSKLRRSGQ